MNLPEIAKLGHIALVTPDMKKSLWFFKEVLGLEETEEVNGTVYLRAWGDFEHHSLSLTPGEKGRVDHIGWKAKRKEDVEGFAQLLVETGTEVNWVEKGDEAGQGRAIRFKLPSQHSFEIYFEMEKTLADKDSRSILKNQRHQSWRKGVSPRRIDHVNIATSMNVGEIHQYLSNQLGFKLREYVTDDKGEIAAAWMSVTNLVHDIAISPRPDEKTPNRLHHISYWLDDAGDLLRAADILSEEGIKFIGPGKHGISQAMYIYVIDPGSGCRVELFTGGYLIFEPDWEPVKWSAEERAVGNTYWGDTVQNKEANYMTIEA
ncbi:VOC family protein [Aquibacillus saliphilus]|uniref:VOC family protein n=1 Tax=Aquibacillus saliphilus TaxID=1909422 RepID=UPI001CF0311A|nr:VOC family protein [Aquibacillus saliphilus]